MRPGPCFLSLCTTFAFLAPAVAQEAVRRAQPVLPEETETSWEIAGEVLSSDSFANGAADVAEDAGEPVALQAGSSWEPGRGRWRVVLHLWGTATYDDNIFIQPTDEVADYIFTIEPGIALGFWDENEERARERERQYGPALIARAEGTLFLLDYTAIGQLFAETSSQNTLGHDARAEGRWQGEKLTVGASLRFESKSETNVDIGDRIRRQTLAGAVTTAYRISEKTALGLEGSYVTSDYEGFDRTSELRGEASFEYGVTPLVRLGLGLGVGEARDDDVAETFERALLRAAYSLSEKVEATFRGGVEFRQSDGRSEDQVNPIFELRAEWRPAVDTYFGLEVFRRVETSALRAEDDYTLTGFGIIVRRTILGGVQLALDAGYRFSEYEDPGTNSRKDHYYFIRPGVYYHFASGPHAGIRFDYRRDDSNRATSDFTNKQVSVEVGLKY